MVEARTEMDDLLNGLEEEAGVYRELLAVSREELKLVKDAELEKATEVLSRKQRMLEDIATIEKRIQPAKERWPQVKASLPPDRVSGFQAALKELSDILEKLIAVERETEDVLSRQISIVRKGVRASVTEDQARKAYGAKSPGRKSAEGKKKD